MHNLESFRYLRFFLFIDLLFFILTSFQPVEVLHGYQMELLGNNVLVVVISRRRVAWKSVVPPLGELFKQEVMGSELVIRDSFVRD